MSNRGCYGKTHRSGNKVFAKYHNEEVGQHRKHDNRRFSVIGSKYVHTQTFERVFGQRRLSMRFGKNTAYHKIYLFQSSIHDGEQRLNNAYRRFGRAL